MFQYFTADEWRQRDLLIRGFSYGAEGRDSNSHLVSQGVNL